MLKKSDYENNLYLIQNLETASGEELATYRGWGSLWNHLDKLKNIESIGTETLQLIQDSALTAYYTEPKLIQAIWQTLLNSGFDGGTILDPCCGIGNFFSEMPTQVRQKSTLVGVEIEPFAAQIARKLHPNATIYQRGFETFRCPDNYFDLSISNIPFSISHLHEHRYSHLNPNLHELFLLKMADLSKVNGLVCAITSTNFLDKQENRIRSALASKLKLLNAWRLPAEMFCNSAGIKITTDIVIFQKIEPSENTTNPPDKEPNWLSSVKFFGINNQLNNLLLENDNIYHNSLNVPVIDLNNTNEIDNLEESIQPRPNDEQEYFTINQHYLNNISNILGKLYIRTDRYNKKKLDVKTNNINAVIEYLKKESVTINRTTVNQNKHTNLWPEEIQDISPGKFVKIHNRYYYLLGQHVEIIEKENKIKKIDKMKTIANIVKTIYIIQREAEKTSEANINDLNKKLKDMQQQYAVHYNDFTKKWGKFQDKQNDELNIDSDYYLIRSTESEEIAPLFKSLELKTAIPNYKTIEDIYNHCLSTNGNLDLTWIEQQVKEWLDNKGSNNEPEREANLIPLTN